MTAADPIACLSDQPAFARAIAALAGAADGARLVTFTELEALLRELGERRVGGVILDMNHRHDDVRVAWRELRRHLPKAPIVVLGLVPDDQNGDQDDGHEGDRRHVAAWRIVRALAFAEPATNAAVGPRDPRARRIWEGLTPRQREVLQHIAEGEDNLKIAACLGISERAVKAHVSVLLDAFGVDNRLQLGVLVSRWAS